MYVLDLNAFPCANHGDAEHGRGWKRPTGARYTLRLRHVAEGVVQGRWVHGDVLGSSTGARERDVGSRGGHGELGRLNSKPGEHSRGEGVDIRGGGNVDTVGGEHTSDSGEHAFRDVVMSIQER